jgi:hypothetical protein
MWSSLGAECPYQDRGRPSLIAAKSVGRLIRGEFMVWLIGVASSIVGAAIWAVIGYGIEARRERTGELAGQWFQITYNPKDTDVVWSIEWIDVKHQGERVSGTMWRIYPESFDRRWSFNGVFARSFIRCPYLPTRGDGGEGFMKLYMFKRSNCLGRFIQDLPKNVDFGPSYVEFAAPLEWIRAGSDDQGAVVKLLATVPKEQMISRLPSRVRKQLQRRMDGMSTTDVVLRNLGYGNALPDMTGPLAMERERLLREDATRKEEPGSAV